MTIHTNLTNVPTTENDPSTTWWQRFKAHGFYMKHAAALTLIMGMYLHFTGLFIGRDLLLKYVLTPRYDMVLAIPMTYAGICGWLLWKRVVHPNRWHRFVYGFLTVYFTLSIPLHVQTYVTQRADYILAFPAWYSYFILPIMGALLWFVFRLQFKPEG